MICLLCNSANPDSAATCQTCGAPLSATTTGALSSALRAGAKLQGGAFTIGKVLGQGGFGITYLGSDTRLSRPVAIKEFFPLSCAARASTRVHPTGTMSADDYAKAREKFLEEARVLARFQNPGIVNVYASFEENCTAYLAMELLRGQSLMQVIEKRRVLPESEAVACIEKVGQALEAVHAAGMLHRDIKPDNIMLCDDGRVVLIDFGTAREFAAGHTRSMTAMLTVGYAPLEQYGKQAKFGPYTDVYALGATLYHALTGQCPTAATDRVSGVPLSPPHRMRLDGNVLPISRPVSEAVMWALELRAADRPQTMRDFLLALRSTKTSPRPSSGKSPSGSDASTRNVAPSDNPHLPRMRQLLAELASPPDAPPSVHDVRLNQIETQLDALKTFSSTQGQCPACRQPLLQNVATRQAVGECPLCATSLHLVSPLEKRALDEAACAICRGGRLQEHQMPDKQMFCPLCKVSPLREERRKKFGLALDLWLACPTCKAEWDVFSNGTAKLMNAGKNVGGLAATHLNQTLPLAQWKQLAGRADRVLRCAACAAQFDAPDDKQVTLVQVFHDPHGVGKQFLGRTFFRRAWARLAKGLPLGAGDYHCAACLSEWNFDDAARTLKLLQSETKLPWAQSWRGQAVPLAAWYFAAAGKSSLRAGRLCSGCNTEFDDEGVQWKLRKTLASTLAPRTGEVHLCEDWQRLARGLPQLAEEKQWRDEKQKLQNAKQAEQANWRQSQAQRAQQREAELDSLLKQSCLAGLIALNLGGSGVALKSGEALRWKSATQMFRQRTRDHYPYWDLENNGTLLVTNQRIVLEVGGSDIWSRPLNKLRVVDASYQGGAPFLSLSFTGLKKPVGFLAGEMRVNAALENQSRPIALGAGDLAQLLQSLKP